MFFSCNDTHAHPRSKDLFKRRMYSLLYELRVSRVHGVLRLGSVYISADAFMCLCAFGGALDIPAGEVEHSSGNEIKHREVIEKYLTTKRCREQVRQVIPNDEAFSLTNEINHQNPICIFFFALGQAPTYISEDLLIRACWLNFTPKPKDATTLRPKLLKLNLFFFYLWTLLRQDTFFLVIFF